MTPQALVLDRPSGKLLRLGGSTLNLISSWATGRRQCESARVQGRDVIADYLSLFFRGVG